MITTKQADKIIELLEEIKENTRHINLAAYLSNIEDELKEMQPKLQSLINLNLDD